ncbi:MAG: DUF349 domain-containing protein [Saprospiraceae bacterium]
MKVELIEKFKTLLQTEDIASIKHDVRDLMSQYNSETAKEKQLQAEEWKKKQEAPVAEEVAETSESVVEGAPETVEENAVEASEEASEPEVFEFVPNTLDETLETLFVDYKERVKEHGKMIAAEQKKNLDQKTEILAKLDALIKDEENIGKAFASFNELNDEWNGVGNVPGDKWQELQDEYRRLRDLFFYNINIYKQLQENDLLRNEKEKVALIERLKEIKAIESIRETDQKLRELRREWDLIGPVTQENYKSLGDDFFGMYKEIIERVQKHYDGLREEQEANLEKKKETVVKLKEILDLEITQHPTWVKKTEDVIAIQKEWKEIGFGPKKENEEVWQEFRGLCDLFFEKKQQFYNQRSEKQEEAKAKKAKIAEEAKQWVESTDWKTATDALIRLQSEWKSAGTTFQKEEQKLWSSFRTACDKFFDRKKEYFKNQDSIQDENLKAKLALVAEIEAYTIVGNRNDDLENLRAFSNRWKEIGYVPKKALQSSYKKYNDALDGKYSELKLQQGEKSVNRYKGRIASLKESPNSNNDIRREKKLLYDKVDRLKERVIQYENNMNFFSGGGAEKMRAEVQRKVDASKREIEEIKEKLKLFQED